MEVIVFIVFIFWLFWGGVFSGWDDTDEKHKDSMCRRSSDLVVKYDYGTGLQYLVGPFGGVTPRLDADGNHMKIPEEELQRKPERKWLSWAFYALIIVAFVFFSMNVAAIANDPEAIGNYVGSVVQRFEDATKE